MLYCVHLLVISFVCLLFGFHMKSSESDAESKPVVML